MRLLLDEHFSRHIAEQLRTRGHDAVAVGERADLAGLPDDELLAAAQQERRAIVTENWADFARLLDRAAADGAHHYGVVFTSRRRLPRSRATIGLITDALAAFLAAHPAEDALRDGSRWLP